MYIVYIICKKSTNPNRANTPHITPTVDQACGTGIFLWPADTRQVILTCHIGTQCMSLSRIRHVLFKSK